MEISSVSQSYIAALLSGGSQILDVGFESDEQVIVLAQTRTAGDQVTADHVLLQVLQRIDLALDGSLVEHLGGLLERSGRDEARRLQRRTGDTLQAPDSRSRARCRAPAPDCMSLRLRLEFSSRSLRSEMICPGCTDVESPASVTTTLSYSSSLTSMNSHLSTIWSSKKRVSPGSSICTFVHHLTDDHLEMLVVDLHALHAVHLLHLVDDVLLHLRRAEDMRRMSLGVMAPSDSGLPGLHVVVLLHDDLTRQRHQITLHVALLGGDDDLAVTALDLAERNLAVDFRNDRPDSTGCAPRTAR